MAGKQFRPKFFVGKKNFPASDEGSASALNQQFQSSMKEIVDNLWDFIQHMEGVSSDILVEALEPTFGKAIEYCPKDTHALVNSAYLETESFRGGARAEMGFGRGGNPSYAIYVHEMPYAHEFPTRSKFLEAAIDEDYFSIISSLPRIVNEYAGTN